MQKKIFINSYTKQDGTTVKAHYRTIDAEDYYYDLNEDPYNHGPMPQKKGNFPESDDQNNQEENNQDENSQKDNTSEGGGFGEILGEILPEILQAAGYAAQIYVAMQNNSGQQKKIPNVDIPIKLLNTAKTKSEKTARKYLDDLTVTKNNEEYKRLFKHFTEQKELSKRINRKLTKIQYARDNDNYSMLMDELNNFNSDFDEIISKTRKTRPLKTEEYIKELYKKYHYKTPTNRSPLKDKKFLDVGTNTFSKILPDAKELWQASSHDFKYSKQYINNNGYLVYSVKDLPTYDLRQIVTKKIKEQLKIDDTLGVVFKTNSSLSKVISESPEIRNFFIKHKDKLLNGGVIKNTSDKLDNKANLYGSFNYVDIIYSYIDYKDNSLNLIIFDTWDFNPGEKFFIKMARNTQESKLIRNYYILTLVKIHPNIWLRWLLLMYL